MGLKKQNPRYNVISCRVSDDLRACINHALGGRSMQDFIHAAIEAALIEERQVRIDRIVRKARHADQA
jgi:hypothetical protein